MRQVADVEPIPDEYAWMLQGSCRGADTRAFFPSNGLGVEAAQRICHECEVRAECLEYALAEPHRARRVGRRVGARAPPHPAPPAADEGVVRKPAVNRRVGNMPRAHRGARRSIDAWRRHRPTTPSLRMRTRSRRWTRRWRRIRSRCSRRCARACRSCRSRASASCSPAGPRSTRPSAHPETFSSNMSAVDLKNIRPLIPLQIDPPDHKKYRKILDPIFAPRQMALLEEPVTAARQRPDRRLHRPRRDRLRRRVLGAVPVAGVPHAARPPARRAPALPRDEGRHHPARSGHRHAVRQRRDARATSGRPPTRSTTTSTRCSTSARPSGATTSSASFLDAEVDGAAS